MRPFAIGGLQLSLPARGDNLPRMRERLDHLMAMFPWVQMVVFSELAVRGPWTGNATDLPGPIEEAFGAMARKHGIWLVNGSQFEKRDGKVYNTTSVLNPDGEVVGRYRKMFPFRPYEVGVSDGTKPLVFDVPDVGRFGVSICYDMWFPETSRQLAVMGAEVILHPSMTTTLDRDVELAIARATAATNQCFVVDINGAGDVGNGRSVIVGPAGDVLHQAGHSEELIPLEIDLDRVQRTREVGLRGLGQTLKSFRDSEVRFRFYTEPAAMSFLRSLGPLKIPDRGTRAGLRDADTPVGPETPAPSDETPPTAAAAPASGEAPAAALDRPAIPHGAEVQSREVSRKGTA